MPLGVSPRVWGPSGWRLLHGLARAAADAPSPEAARAARARFRALVGALREVLPCPACRENIAGHLGALPFPRRAADLPRWTFRLHHRVNGTQPARDGPTYAAVAAARRAAEPFRPADALPFLEAIAATHPGSREAPEAYAAALRAFFGALGDALPSAPRPADLASRTALKRWLSELKRTLGAAPAAASAPVVAAAECRLGDPHACGAA